MEVSSEHKLVFHNVREHFRITEYIIRFDTETARINSIAIIIGLLTGFVIGIYDRTLRYSNTFLGMQQKGSRYTSSHTIMYYSCLPWEGLQ